MDPLTIGMLGLQAVGSGLNSANQAKMNKRQLEAQRQQANQSLGQNYQQMGQQDAQYGQTSNMNRQQLLDQRLGQASQVQNQLNMNPLRDRAAFMMQSRLGVPPAAFQARDFTRGTMPGAGNPSGGMAPVANAMQTAAGQYRAGAGGMDDSALRAQMAGLRDQSQMPGMYQAQNANQLRFGAEAQQNAIDAANAKYARDRVRNQEETNRLAASLGIDPSQVPTMATAQDRRQMEIDREKKEAANRRMMAMIGGGALLATPFMPAALGALGSAMSGAGKGAALLKNVNAIKTAAAAAPVLMGRGF